VAALVLTPSCSRKSGTDESEDTEDTDSDTGDASAGDTFDTASDDESDPDSDTDTGTDSGEVTVGPIYLSALISYTKYLEPEMDMVRFSPRVGSEPWDYSDHGEASYEGEIDTLDGTVCDLFNNQPFVPLYEDTDIGSLTLLLSEYDVMMTAFFYDPYSQYIEQRMSDDWGADGAPTFDESPAVALMGEGNDIAPPITVDGSLPAAATLLLPELTDSQLIPNSEGNYMIEWEPPEEGEVSLMFTFDVESGPYRIVCRPESGRENFTFPKAWVEQFGIDEVSLYFETAASVAATVENLTIDLRTTRIVNLPLAMGSV
jgi:hypothetical protein